MDFHRLTLQHGEHPNQNATPGEEMATTNDGQFEDDFRPAGEDALEYIGGEALYTATADPDDEDDLEDDEDEDEDEDDDLDDEDDDLEDEEDDFEDEDDPEDEELEDDDEDLDDEEDVELEDEEDE
jgi:ribonuclease E